MISRSAFILEKSDTSGHSPTLVFPRKKICMVKIQSQAVQKLQCKRGFNLLLHTKQIGPEKGKAKFLVLMFTSVVSGLHNTHI